MESQHQLHFDSLEELNSAPHGWDTDITPLGGETAPATLGLSSNDNVLLTNVVLNCATLQTGSTPGGMRTFSLLTRQRDQHCFRGHSVDCNTLIVFPKDRELHAISSGDIALCNISVSEESFQRAMDTLEIPGDVLIRLPETIGFSDSQRRQLLREMEILSRFLKDYGDHSQAKELSVALEESLVTAVLGTLVDIARFGRPINRNKRYRYTHQALDYLRANPRENIGIGDLAQAAGTSRRTLEIGFREILDVSPGDFIKTSRLRACRKELLEQRGNRGASVSNTANGWGFWHLGQFSTDYRKQFGELPSQTLQA